MAHLLQILLFHPSRSPLWTTRCLLPQALSLRLWYPVLRTDQILLRQGPAHFLHPAWWPQSLLSGGHWSIPLPPLPPEYPDPHTQRSLSVPPGSGQIPPALSFPPLDRLPEADPLRLPCRFHLWSAPPQGYLWHTLKSGSHFRLSGNLRYKYLPLHRQQKRLRQDSVPHR